MSSLNEPSSFRWTISFMMRSKWTGFPYGARPITLYSALLTLKPR